ncbi:MAG TPA: hypothetical protein PKE62_14920 [Anaerolineales bacterium]|nr:hypothetical protein [Anaerolineales bacterium]
MINIKLTFLFFLLGGTLFLFPSFNGDGWGMVREYNYRGWQTTSERVVVARLAKSQQDGLFSAGGLLGLLDAPDGWVFGSEIANRQYEIYETGEPIQSYLVYKSHPGFQGIVFGLFDSLTKFPASTNLEIFRTSVALASSIAIALMAAGIAVEFGRLAAAVMLLLAAVSEWMILPAGSLYWNLWAFFLPFVCGMYLLAEASKKNNYPAFKIYFVIFITIWVKILFTGFEIITTALVMATVPFVYFAIRDRWQWKTFFQRATLLGVSLVLATFAGLGTLILQITAANGSLKSGIYYVRDTFIRRAAGNADEFRGQYAESLGASHLEVIGKYLNSQAFSFGNITVVYWHLIALFAVFTLLYLYKHRATLHAKPSNMGIALVATTWYSILAPLSWYTIFKPTAYIHTFLFPMAWQMPFTLLGFALCGFVIQDLIRPKTAELT